MKNFLSVHLNFFKNKNSPSSRIAAIALPNGEKAASVVCLENLVIVLSSNGRVFSSDVTKGSSALSFSAVKELEDQNITFVSSTYIHCFAVNKEGRVFGKGSNTSGRLGLSKETRSVSSFTLISSLEKYEIKAAYAGDSHSLFETREGKIIACGNNSKGELLLKSGSFDNVYSPTETMITGGAKFCISGFKLSAIFIGYSLPINTPNMVINSYQLM